MLSGVYSLDKSLQVLEQALGEAPSIPEAIMTRTRLRSDAMRAMSSNKVESMQQADELFTEAIELELEGSIVFNPNLTEEQSAEQAVDRLRELRMMRGNTRGSQVLADYEGSIGAAELAQTSTKTAQCLDAGCVCFVQRILSR